MTKFDQKRLRTFLLFYHQSFINEVYLIFMMSNFDFRVGTF